jgi:DNA-binding CsgD family transcriptional regulator
MRASHRVYDSVLRILPALYACGTVREFVTRTVRLLPSVIDADGYGWFVHSFGPQPAMVDFVESEPSIITSAMAVRMGQSALTHPFTSHWATAKEISALKFSDFPLKVRERFVSENWDIHRDMGREYLTIPVSFNTNRIHAVSLRRDRRWFNEEDRWVMNVLAPHLRQAHANAITFEKATQHPSGWSVSTECGLTTRESEVGFWVSQGKTNLEIGLILGISGRTVEKHMEHILRKLGIENRAIAAVVIANALAPRQRDQDA